MAARTALDLTATVMTPENIAFEYRLAGPFRRFPAFFLDLLVRLGSMLLLLVLIVCAGIANYIPLLETVGGILLVIGYFLFDWFYGLFFETIWNGKTPGKYASGLRVISVDGRPISAYQATIRNFLRLGDLAPFASLQMFSADAPPVYWIPTAGVSLACMLLTRRMQRLGDLAAGTMVVIDHRTWVPPKIKLNDPAIDRLVAQIHANFRMPRTMVRTIAMYVERRGGLSPNKRRDLASILASELIQGAGVPSSSDADLFLCALYKREYDTNWKSLDKEDVQKGLV